MGKIVQVSAGKMAVVSLVIVMALTLAGCALVGQVTQVDNQILFGNEDKKQGIFTQGALTVDYSYRLSGGNINLEGQVEFFRSC